MAKTLRIEYDVASDTLTVEDVRWCGDFFRGLTWTNVPGAFVIERRRDGIIEISPIPLPEDRLEDAA